MGHCRPSRYVECRDMLREFSFTTGFLLIPCIPCSNAPEVFRVSHSNAFKISSLAQNFVRVRAVHLPRVGSLSCCHISQI